jgi:uncharacterized membrane protein YraQ (UPF0718 family)
MKNIFKNYGVEIVIGVIAIVLLILNPEKAIPSLLSAFRTWLSLVPVIIGIALLTALISVLLPKERIGKIIGKDSGLPGLFAGALFGSLMVGPAYVFFPFFGELKNKGASDRIIATTIGAWAIKPTWIPFAVTILGWKFVSIFNILLFLFAILSGIFVQAFMKQDQR